MFRLWLIPLFFPLALLAGAASSSASFSEKKNNDNSLNALHIAQKNLEQHIDVKAIRFILSDKHVILGETQHVSLKLKATLPNGKPLDVAPPHLRASTGTLSAPRRIAAGEWSTVFTPPKDRFPHVAILSAQIDTRKGPSVGFASLPLWGKGQLAVKTKPKSEVVVFLGNRKFGPAQSGKSGLARVDILAPPGPERAVAKSTDEVGNQSQEIVDLKVPSFNRLAIVPIDEVITADGAGVAQILVFLVDKKGVPMYDAPLKIKASIGGLQGAPQGLAPGIFRLFYHPGKTSKKEAQIDVTLKGKGSEASKASFKIRLLPGGPVTAKIIGETHSLSADAPREVRLVLQLFDEANNIVVASAGKIDVDKGRISQVKNLDEQKQEVFWLLPAKIKESNAKKSEKVEFPAMDIATFSIRSRRGKLLAEYKIERRVGKLAQISASPIPSIVADGQTAVKVQLKAIDLAGNELSARDVQVEVEKGRVSADYVESNKRFIEIIFRRIDDHMRAKVRFFVKQDGSENTLPIADIEQEVRLKPPRIRTKLLAGFGLVSDWNFSQAIGAGIEGSFHLRLPILDGSVHTGLRIATLFSLPASSSYTVNASTRTQTTLPFLFEAQWRNEHLLDLFLPGTVLFAGGSLGFIFVETTDVFDDKTLSRERVFTTAFGAGAFVGAGYLLGKGALEAELHLLGALPISGTAYLGTPIGLGCTLRYRFML